MRYLLAATVALAMQTASADWTTSLQQAWERTKTVGGDLYQSAQDASKRAWESTTGLFSATPQEDANMRLDQQDARYRKILAETLAKLEHGVAIMEEQEGAPQWAFFHKDKAEFQEDFNDLLDGMTTIFEQDAIIQSRERIFSLRQGIDETKEQILKLKEQQLAAPRHDRLKATKDDYGQQIAERYQHIADQQAEIKIISRQFIDKLRALGITLTPEEAEILLARVDSGDIVQMAVVFNTAKKIDGQLLRLMADSGEDVAHAKRYYGMHVVLLELVRYMQDRYLADIDQHYVPQLENIIANTKTLYESSKAAHEEDNVASRKRGYATNMRANRLTIDTAELYIELLKSQRVKVATAHERLESDLRLAKNTYATVRYSAELLAVLKTSRRAFDTLMGLQIPAMQPFTNLRMQREFEALSRRIAARG